MGKKNEKVCTTPIYIKNFLLLASGYLSISTFAFLVAVPTGITSSAVDLQICSITT